MKATKYTLQIELQALSKDCLPGILQQVMDGLQREVVKSQIRFDDGDTANWEIISEEVEF